MVEPRRAAYRWFEMSDETQPSALGPEPRSRASAAPTAAGPLGRAPQRRRCSSWPPASAFAAAAPALLRSAGALLPPTDPFEGSAPAHRSAPRAARDPGQPRSARRSRARSRSRRSPQPARRPRPPRLRAQRRAPAARAPRRCSGRPVGEVKAGELVMIVRESGDWALVWAGGADNFMKGWARKSGIAVR